MGQIACVRVTTVLEFRVSFRPIALSAVIALATTPSLARPEYIDGVPGVDCGSCHVSAGGGGPRNAFGADVEAKMPFTGPTDETWAILFCIDSDGDGKTNGQELGDPCGTWRVGDTSPTAASNPGDEASTTDVEGECDGAAPPTCDIEDQPAGGGCSASTSMASAGALLGLLAMLRRRRR
jgi:uncharacterized protein (TIGR03382 family)